MSETNTNQNSLITIKAPELNQSNYAMNLSETFNNIDKNFSTLANYDFVKGESGNSIKFKEERFFDDKGITEYGTKLKEYFTKKYPDEIDKVIEFDGKTLGLFDNFTPETAGTLQVVVEYDNNLQKESKIVSSYYYVFLDGRFANNVIGDIEEKSFDGLEDLSCILVYDGKTEQFKALENAFPTIYFEDGKELCWKINGNNTGIPVKGVPGNDGKTTTMVYVVCENPENDTNYKSAAVTYIYEYPKHISVEDPEIDLNNYDDCAALILIHNENESFTEHLYFGKLKYDNNNKTLIANYYEADNLIRNADKAVMIDILKSINIKDNEDNNIKGLFLPIRGTETDKTSAHFLCATGIVNNNTDNIINNEMMDVVMTPVNDIDRPGLNINVEKHLYLNINVNNIPDNNVKEYFKTNSNVLKFTLSNIKDDTSDLGNIPREFTGKRLYVWNLVQTGNTDVDTYFAHAYTLTITPNSTSDISLNKSNITDLFGFNRFEFILKNNDNLETIKDTSLNINYDVNIIGTENKPNKNVNISGDLHAKDIYGGNLQADTIKVNKNKIVGDTSGAKLQYKPVVNAKIEVKKTGAGVDSTTYTPYLTEIEIDPGNHTIYDICVNDQGTLKRITSLKNHPFNNALLEFPITEYTKKSYTVENNFMVGNGNASQDNPVEFKLEIHLICDIDIDTLVFKDFSGRGIKCFDYSFTGKHKPSAPGESGEGGDIEKPDEEGPGTAPDSGGGLN